MSNNKIELGKSGEELATNFLENKGYKILERNFKSRLGEIDIIAQQGRTICFIEVRTRTSLWSGLPQESIDEKKQHHLCRVALVYLKKYNFLEKPARFDVLAVCLNEDKPKIELIKDAFNLSRYYSY